MMITRRHSVIAGAILLAGMAGATSGQAPPVRKLVPEFTIDGSAAELNQISQLVIAPNGNVIVIGNDAFHGKVFGPNGKLIRNFARGGRGPGEIASTYLPNAGMLGDTLWIEDDSNRRISLYTSDGLPIRDVPYNRSTNWTERQPDWAGLRPNVAVKRLLPGDIAFGVPVGALSTKVLVGRGQGDGDRVPLMQLRWDGSVVGPTLILTRPYQFFSIVVGPNSRRSFGQELAHRPRYDLSPDGKRIVIATIRDGATPTVELLHLSTMGDTLGKFRIPFAPDPITRHSVDSMVAAWVAPRPTANLPPNFPPQPSLAGREGEIRDSLVVPKYFPPFNQVLLANDGTTWLHWHAPGTRLRWLVVSPGGKVLMQVEPQKGEIRLIDQGVWAIVHDDDGVPSIVRFGFPPK